MHGVVDPHCLRMRRAEHGGASTIGAVAGDDAADIDLDEVALAPARPAQSRRQRPKCRTMPSAAPDDRGARLRRRRPLASRSRPSARHPSPGFDRLDARWLRPALEYSRGVAEAFDFEGRLDGAQSLDKARAVLPGDSEAVEGRIIGGRNETQFQPDAPMQQAAFGKHVAQQVEGGRRGRIGPVAGCVRASWDRRRDTSRSRPRCGDCGHRRCRTARQRPWPGDRRQWRQAARFRPPARPRKLHRRASSASQRPETRRWHTGSSRAGREQGRRAPVLPSAGRRGAGLEIPAPRQPYFVVKL